MRQISDFQKILNNLIEEKESDAVIYTSGVDPVFENIDFKVQSFSGGVGLRYRVPQKPKTELEVEIKPILKTMRISPLTYDQKRAIEFFIKLGMSLKEEASLEEIKSAYRRLAKKYHPDLNSHQGDQFKQISLAYKKLIKGF